MLKRNLRNVKEVINDIKYNHNWALFDEILFRNKNNLDKVALFYRGTNITYREMLSNMLKYANVLSKHGIKEKMSIPVCMNNTPEFVYLLGAASILGVELNIFGEEFDKDYITEIINGCNADFIFVSDDKYEKIKDSINKSKVSNIVMSSLASSLKNEKDPYEKFDKHFYKLENKISDYKDSNDKIIGIDEFIEDNENKNMTINDILKERYRVTDYDATLDDKLTTTYSSGSTNSSRPKAITHINKSYITMGTFHDPNVSGTPSMKDLRVLAHIPTHSNTNVQSCITDSLIQGSTVCLEPIYNKDFFMYSLLINKTHFPCATRSFWINLCKMVSKFEKMGIKIRFPFLMAPMSVGEPLSIGEEKLCNKTLRKTDAGVDFTHTPKSITCMSVAGGDCEHGGIFFIMFRNLMNLLKRIPTDEYDILRTYSMVDVVALDEDGNICEKGQIGRLYAYSETNMLEYKNNEDANKKAFKIINGKKYLDCSVYGYIGKNDYIHVKGRMNEFTKELPSFKIADKILEDYENILSCEVVATHDSNNNPIYVAHIEMQPNVKMLDPVVLKRAVNRCKIAFGQNISDNIIFRVRSFEESFPLTGCGKRNVLKLSEEGLEETIRPIVTRSNQNGFFVSAIDYINKRRGKTLQYTAN